MSFLQQIYNKEELIYLADMSISNRIIENWMYEFRTMLLGVFPTFPVQLLEPLEASGQQTQMMLPRYNLSAKGSTTL
jgi:hypothetical protein